MKKIPHDPGVAFVRSLATSPQLLESCRLQRAYSPVRLLSVLEKLSLVSGLLSASEDPLVVCSPAILHHVYLSEGWTLPPRPLLSAPAFLRVTGSRRTLESCFSSMEAGTGLMGRVWLCACLCDFLLNQAQSPVLPIFHARMGHSFLSYHLLLIFIMAYGCRSISIPLFFFIQLFLLSFLSPYRTF